MVSILAPAVQAFLNIIEKIAPAIALMIIGVTAVRAFRWVGKAISFFVSPLLDAIAAMKAFADGAKGVSTGLNNIGSNANAIGKNFRSLKLSIQDAFNPGVKQMDRLKSSTADWNKQIAAVSPQLKAVQGRLNSLHRIGPISSGITFDNKSTQLPAQAMKHKMKWLQPLSSH